MNANTIARAIGNAIHSGAVTDDVYTELIGNVDNATIVIIGGQEYKITVQEN